MFDWAGTVIDFGSIAPAQAFIEAFQIHGLDPTKDEARAPMGLPKRDHIERMLAAPRLAEQWAAQRGSAPDRAAVDAIYETFLPLSERGVAYYTQLIPGAAETAAWLRDQGIRIASTTGYTRLIMERVIPAAAAQGFTPEIVVCSDELVVGRPGPLGVYKCMVELGVFPPEAVLKVDDTPAGIAEGVSAGSPTVGITLSGNLVGLAEEDLTALPAGEVSRRCDAAAAQLRNAGADHILDTVADLPSLVRQLSE